MTPELALLARLRDVHPPHLPSWWPPAPGWWLLALLGVAMMVIAFRFAPPWWRRFRLRRHLFSLLDGIARRHRAGAPAEAIAGELSQLLRLAALARFPQHDVAGLHGADWVAFLESCDQHAGRLEKVRDQLIVAPYGPPGAYGDAGALLHAARDWLRAVV